MSNQSAGRTTGRPAYVEPTAAVLATIDRLAMRSKAAPNEVGPQTTLWKALTALPQWVCINRGTPQAPRPFMLAGESGPILCIFTSAARAKQAAHESGLVPAGEQIVLFAPPLPQAVDWALSYAKYGVVGLAVDYSRLGSWCPPLLTSHTCEMAGQAPQKCNLLGPYPPR